MQESMTDEQLFLDFRSGNDSALQTLIERYTEILGNYVSKRCGGCPASIDEVVQSTFVKVFLHKDRFQEGRSFRPWLLTIADRSAKDFQRLKFGRAKHIRSMIDTRIPEDSDILAAKNLLPPDEIAGRHEDEKRAMQLLKQLPTNLRVAVQLQIVDGQASREVAAGLGVSQYTAWNRSKMGLDVLRKQMQTDQLPVGEAV